MKIVLINPYIEDFYITYQRLTPLGLYINLDFILREKIFFPIFLDMMQNSYKEKKIISLPKDFFYLKDFYFLNKKSPFKMFTNYYRFGINENDFINFIKKCDAKVFAISANFSTYFNEVLNLVGIIKNLIKDPIIILGGTHVLLNYENIVDLNIDYLVLSKDPLTFINLLKKIHNNSLKDLEFIKSIKHNNKVYLDNRDFIFEKFSDDFFEYIKDKHFYHDKGKKIFPLFFTIGCPYKCSYCCVHLLNNNFLFREVKNVISDMLNLYNKLNIKIFDFEDDNLTYNKDKAIELFDNISFYFKDKKDIEIKAMNGLSFKNLDNDILLALKKAYFKELNIPLITKDVNYAKCLKRDLDLNHFENIIDLSLKNKFNLTLYQIVGMPRQTLKEMILTFKYLKKFKQKIAISIYYPIIQTADYFYCLENGYIKKNDLLCLRSSSLGIETENFSRKDLFTFLIASRIYNFQNGFINLFKKDMLGTIDYKNLNIYNIDKNLLCELLN